jgi:hypothetical protein
MISTYYSHDKRTVTVRGKEVQKPVSMTDYNKNMGGTDFKDQMLQMYLIERKIMHKRYHKLFKRPLNATVLNALIVYRRNCDKPMEHLSFRVLLVEGLFSKFGATGEGKVGQPGRHASDNRILRLTEPHFLGKVQPIGEKVRPQRRCVVCTKHGRKKETCVLLQRVQCRPVFGGLL